MIMQLLLHLSGLEFHIILFGQHPTLKTVLLCCVTPLADQKAGTCQHEFENNFIYVWRTTILADKENDSCHLMPKK